MTAVYQSDEVRYFTGSVYDEAIDGEIDPWPAETTWKGPWFGTETTIRGTTSRSDVGDRIRLDLNQPHFYTEYYSPDPFGEFPAHPRAADIGDTIYVSFTTSAAYSLSIDGHAGTTPLAPNDGRFYLRAGNYAEGNVPVTITFSFVMVDYFADIKVVGTTREDVPFEYELTISTSPIGTPGPTTPSPTPDPTTPDPTTPSPTPVFGDGPLVLVGGFADFAGKTLPDFGTDDVVRFSDGVTGISDLIINGNEIRLKAGGANSDPLILEGDFSNGRFLVAPSPDGGTDLFFQSNLADAALVEGQEVAESAVNGAPHPSALTGDGTRTFQVALSDLATAANVNALGVYEIDADGNIIDARILFGDVKDGANRTATVDGVEAGHRLGFFIVGGGTESGAATFTDTSGGSADLSDGAGLRLSVGGGAVSGDVFHAFSASLNADGLAHARSGADPSGHGVRIAFEDLAGGGDRDFQDVVFRVDMVDAGGDFIL